MSGINARQAVVVMLVAMLSACGGGGGGDSGSTGAPASGGGGTTPPGGGGTVTPVVVAPTISSGPDYVSVTEGSVGNFGVTVAGTAPFSYQWRRNGVDIPGANLPGYSTPATVLADNGTAYDVVVSNAAGSVTSAGALLTVTALPVIPVAKTWKSQKLENDLTILSRGLFKPFSADEGLRWLAKPGATAEIRKAGYTEGSGWSASATPWITGLSDEAATDQIAMAENGAWRAVAWTYNHVIWARIIGPGVDTGDVMISTPAPGDHFSAKAVISSTGEATFVWNNGGTLAARTYKDAAWQAVQLFPGFLQWIEALVPTGSGKALLLYHVYTSNSAGMGTEMHYMSRLLESDGVGAETQVDVPTGAFSWANALAVSDEGSGNISVVWHEESSPYSSNGSCIGVRRYRAGTWESAQCINGAAPQPVFRGDGYSAPAANAAGEMVNAWITADSRVLMAARRSAAGIWAAPVPLATSTDQMRGPYTMLSTTGKAAVVYTVTKTTGKTELYVVTGDAAGWDAAFKVGETTITYGSFFDAAINSDGVPAIMWLQHDTSDSLLFRQKSAAGWSGVSTAASGITMTQTVFGSLYSVGQLRIFPRSSGNWGAVWEQKDAGEKVIYTGLYD